MGKNGMALGEGRFRETADHADGHRLKISVIRAEMDSNHWKREAGAFFPYEDNE
jgi:hypothetical protein